MRGAPPSTGGAKRLPRAAGVTIPEAMSEQRALAAIERIERALVRLEAAAERQPPGPRPEPELRRLREVHEALRGRVEGAIEQIDRLLATAAPESAGAG
jgi:hypothetical protein